MLTSIAFTLARLSDEDLDRKRAFGRRVRDLRRSHRFSRNQLQQLSGVPDRTIVDIEKADKATLDRKTVMLLAQAFGLHGVELREFVLAAGLAPEHPLDAPNLDTMIRLFYAESCYPAYMTNALLDLHSCNGYLLALLGVPLLYLERAAYRSAGPNLLRFLFDPEMNARTAWGSAWREVATWNVRFFRQTSLPYAHQPRYTQLMQALRQLPDFDTIWQDSGRHADAASPPHVSIVHSSFGAAKVMHTEVLTDEVIRRQLRAVLYVPLDDPAQVIFTQLRQNVSQSAIQFGNCDVGRFTRLL